jgi:hypothetical protein
MAQRQDLEGEIVPTSKDRKRIGQKNPENGQHNPAMLITKFRQSTISGATDFLPHADGPSATYT